MFLQEMNIKPTELLRTAKSESVICLYVIGPRVSLFFHSTKLAAVTCHIQQLA